MNKGTKNLWNAVGILFPFLMCWLGVIVLAVKYSGQWWAMGIIILYVGFTFASFYVMSSFVFNGGRFVIYKALQRGILFFWWLLSGEPRVRNDLVYPPAS